MGDVTLLWSWHYGCLEVEPCDSLDDALSWAYGMSDAGTGSPSHIEVCHDDGTYETYDHNYISRQVQEREDEAAAERAPYRPPVAMVYVTRAEGKEGRWGVYSDMSDAERVAVKYPMLASRLRIEDVSARYRR